jgi:hypothetical protein
MHEISKITICPIFIAAPIRVAITKHLRSISKGYVVLTKDPFDSRINLQSDGNWQDSDS